MLCDLGRAIDLKEACKRTKSLSALETKLVGDATSQDMRCVAMRQNLPWSFDLDTFGICAGAHVLLFGKHIAIQKDAATNRWILTDPLKQNLQQKEIWQSLFDTLLNLEETLMTAVGSHPQNLHEMCNRFEEYLNNNKEELLRALREQAAVLPSTRAELY